MRRWAKQMGQIRSSFQVVRLNKAHCRSGTSASPDILRCLDCAVLSERFAISGS